MARMGIAKLGTGPVLLPRGGGSVQGQMEDHGRQVMGRGRGTMSPVAATSRNHRALDERWLG